MAADVNGNQALVHPKRMNKRQLLQKWNRLDMKLNCAEKNVTATQKKLIATKAHCEMLASLAKERRKDSRLAHQEAEREVTAICKELDTAETKIDEIIGDTRDRIIAEQLFYSDKAKLNVASDEKHHHVELELQLRLQQTGCNDTINQMQLSFNDTCKKASHVHKRKVNQMQLIFNDTCKKGIACTQEASI
jgi:hypothetical protein